MKRIAWGRIGCMAGMLLGFFASEEYPSVGSTMIATFVFAAVALHGIAVWRSLHAGG